LHPETRRPALLTAVAATGLAIVISAVGLSDLADRAGRPEIALRLFGARGAAAADLAATRQRQGDVTAPPVLARQALAASLLHVEAIRVLGLADALRGNRVRAARLMALAGRGGWRDAPTQLWLVHQGLRSGDNAGAASRIDALLRLSVARPQLFAMIRRSLGNPPLRAALVERFASRPAWRAAFFQQAGDTSAAEYGNVDALVRDLTGTAARLSRAELAPYLRHLVAAGEFGRAYALWRDVSGSPATMGWPNPVILANPLPFDWILTPPFGATLRVDAGQFVVDAAEAGGVVATRQLYLAPGPYDLTFVIPKATVPAAWQWRLRCPAGGALLFPIVHAAGSFRFRFARAACPAPLLELGLREPDPSRPAEFRMGSVGITPSAY
jgi:hypothetical protein